MKKTLLYLAALLCCVCTLTACGSDDEPSATATGTYTVTFGPDFFKAAKHVNIYYKGEDGANKNDVVTQGAIWTKTVTSKRFPAELGFKVVVEPREENELTQDTYNIEVKAAIAGAVSTGGSFSNSQTLITGPQVPKDQVLRILNRDKESSYGYKLGRDGNASQYTPSF